LSILDAQKFSVTCDQCGRKFEKTVGEINSNTKITCPECGRGFDTKPVQADLKKAAESDGLSKTVEDVARKLR
jgi:DNA-directed RNA polymerase subunit RPC12/RpoP